MKTTLLTIMTLILTTSAAFAATSPQGEGMFCAPTAEARAQKIALAKGIPRNIVAQAVTASLDPEEGILYKTMMGNFSVYTVVTGHDGDCRVEYAKALSY